MASFRASDHANDPVPHLLLCASGSVATIKIPQVLHALSRYRISICLVLTSSAQKFLSGQSPEQPDLNTLAGITNVYGIYSDDDEWTMPALGVAQKHEGQRNVDADPGWTRNAPILHIELRRWADLMVIAPLSANTLAKIVNGHADNLVTSVARAWDTDGSVDGIRNYERKDQSKVAVRKRLVVAPAMNTAMWRHPITKRQIDVLENEWGVRKTVRGVDVGNEDGSGWFEVLRPMIKELACGDVGDGAMVNWTDIVWVIEDRLGLVGHDEKA